MISLEIIEASRKIKPTVQQGKPHHMLEIAGKARITVQTSPADLSNLQATSSLDQIVAAAVYSDGRFITGLFGGMF